MSTLRDFFPPVTPTTQPFMQVQDQKPTGTGGGASVTGDNQRTLNTVIYNDIVGASLANNEVALPAGAYYVEASCSMMASDGKTNKINRLQIITPSTPLVGIVYYSFSAFEGLQPYVAGNITLSSPGAIAVSLYINDGVGKGLGISTGQTPYEVYTDFRIWQIRAGV